LFNRRKRKKKKKVVGIFFRSDNRKKIIFLGGKNQSTRSFSSRLAQTHKDEREREEEKDGEEQKNRRERGESKKDFLFAFFSCSTQNAAQPLVFEVRAVETHTHGTDKSNELTQKRRGQVHLVGREKEQLNVSTPKKSNGH
jgi:hypothetical protein